MKNTDVIFAIISGQLIGLLALDFLRHSSIPFAFYYTLIFFIFLPTLSVVCLFVAYLIGRKLLFVYQAAKHLLVGAAATVIDLKLFELGTFIFLGPIASKAISFLLSTFIKYLGNKYWAFGKGLPAQAGEQEQVPKELTQFFIVTLVGLAIDVGFFYYFTKVMGPQFSLKPVVWTKVSVLLAAIIAAIWNFVGYKFFVFKK